MVISVVDVPTIESEISKIPCGEQVNDWQKNKVIISVIIGTECKTQSEKNKQS